ncbi:hypothetical protein DV702_04390 [Sporosarcina sp. PTS2304]|uniref:hypothetical protein n=1 Tax=Sporosarcina sp. PTS2304 TaxID=2283194 RepID=UPI000E0E02ED|nr:hypothetical protein [Sporosarcina sp. PTS2304]AXH99038.1 hypothetical protein DV702_04390 [Sporosarcina sp. PTS2304]
MMILLKISFLIFVVVVCSATILINRSMDFLTRYVLFILILSFYFVWVFQITSVLWLILVCAIGLIVNSSVSRIKKMLLLLWVVLFVCFYRVPMLPSDFTNYVGDEYDLHCQSVECVQITQHESGHLQTTIEDITFEQFNSYFFWAVGEIRTEQQSIKAWNIAGFWFPVE